MKHFASSRAALSLACSLIVAGGAQAQAPDAPAEPSTASKVDALFAKYDTTVSPGCSVSVMQDGGIIYKRGYGMADLEHGVPNSPQTVFHIASVSKQFTAASIAMLALDGKLLLDDPVRKYIPELRDFGKPVTIRQLVHHTSGLRDQWSILSLAGWRYSRDQITDEDVMRLVARQEKLNFTPDSQYSYSNTGYTLLAQIVKRVSGQSFREFTQARIFAPLGMTHTHFRDDFTEIVPNIAYGYTRRDGVLKTSVTNFNTVGATSLLTTVEDLALWQENFHTHAVGGEALTKQMLSQGVLSDGEKISYAFGLLVGQYRGVNTVRHSGSDAGYLSELLRFPDQHFSVAVLCNTNDSAPSQHAEDIADIYLAKALAPVDEQSVAALEVPPLAELQRSAGVYLDRDSGSTYRLEVQDQQLVVVSDYGNTVLTPTGKARFKGSRSNELLFQDPAGAGEYRRLAVTAPDAKKPTQFERIAPYTPTAGQLSAYVGSYRSSELDVIYRIKVKDAGLEITSLKFESKALRPVTTDLFKGEAGNIAFTRDGRGRITGFNVNSGRIKGVRFERLATPLL